LWEVLIDLLLEFLVFLGIKKKKKEEPTPLKIDDSTHKKDTSGEIPHQTVSVCSSCQRIVKLDAVYELGKTWCKDCYKTHVLKVKS